MVVAVVSRTCGVIRGMISSCKTTFITCPFISFANFSSTHEGQPYAIHRKVSSLTRGERGNEDNVAYPRRNSKHRSAAQAAPREWPTKVTVYPYQ